MSFPRWMLGAAAFVCLATLVAGVALLVPLRRSARTVIEAADRHFEDTELSLPLEQELAALGNLERALDEVRTSIRDGSPVPADLSDGRWVRYLEPVSVRVESAGEERFTIEIAVEASDFINTEEPPPLRVRVTARVTADTIEIIEMQPDLR